MDPGFVPLPRRAGAKRPRGKGGITGQPRAARRAAPAHSYVIDTDAEAVRALGPPIYDSAVAAASAAPSVHVPDANGGETLPTGAKWEYLDHTADVQVHSWGDSLPEAFVQAALSMWGYMTDLTRIVPDPAFERVIEAEGVDLVSLLFGWMDGCLSAFTSDDFIGSSIAVTHWGLAAPRAAAGAAEGGDGDGGDAEPPAPRVWKITALVRGERFTMPRHTQGTEVKAITYSNMQIFDVDGALYTANDVAAAADAAAAAGADDAAAGGAGGDDAVRGAGATSEHADDAPAMIKGRSTGARRGAADIYVIVDI